MADEGDIDIAISIPTLNHIPTWSYDVFLCFRGDDTRYTFTGNLYNALCKKKIKTFMDHDGLKSGDHISFILTALEESRIAIIVFSKGFASSTYCLDEIVKILECQENRNQQILPIFYNIDPHVCSECGRGSYNKTALTNLQQKKFPNNPEKVQQWMSALSQVAPATTSYKEWQLKNRDKYKYEYERIDKIVEWVTSTIHRYAVFISFWDTDTRFSFVDFLCDALEKERFKIHMHDEKSEELDQISSSLVNTIGKSWLSIIILSENYASSRLCLNELVTILECMKIKNQLVFPIFYKVEASDIRQQRNSFGSAMAKHEKDCEEFGKDCEEVQKWRPALAEVANLKGSHLKTGYEYETIEKVVEVAINALYLPSPSSGFS